MTETVTSLPRKLPRHIVRIEVTPHSVDPVTFGTYTWDDMFYHDVDTELTFTADIVGAVMPTIVEVYWDFGDGAEAVGNPVTHTYQVASPGTSVHCRARDENGNVAWASMNLMLRVP